MFAILSSACHPTANTMSNQTQRSSKNGAGLPDTHPAAVHNCRRTAAAWLQATEAERADARSRCNSMTVAWQAVAAARARLYNNSPGPVAQAASAPASCADSCRTSIANSARLRQRRKRSGGRVVEQKPGKLVSRGHLRCNGSFHASAAVFAKPYAVCIFLQKPRTAFSQVCIFTRTAAQRQGDAPLLDAWLLCACAPRAVAM